MGHELVLIKSGKKYNITELVGNLSWGSNIDAVSEELTFDYAYNDYENIKKYDIIELGDTVILFNEGKALHRYKIMDESVNGRVSKSYTCYDYAFYLNSNKTIIQFKGIPASDAISKLCDKFNIKHNISPMSTSIKQIYKEEVINTINDIMDQVKKETGSKYRMEMVDDTLTIKKQTDLLIKPMVRNSSITPLFPVTSAISNPSKSTSVVEMKNKVIVATSDDKSTKIFAESSDTANIKKYGLLTEIITVDAKEAAQARNIAKNTLADLNKAVEDVSLDLLGHDDIKAGRLMDFNEPITGVIGRYLIKSAAHSEANGLHKVSVQLEKVS
ncbi:hypothetical protein H1230_13390 [Paenibacillus sp. 19GGS1-52]|uniref:XkdQ/YqbQ family protein n=1 Tax=Paenibacillus sp. 19GGS1-52 TaxID=2758563 RepID=UPI001EFC0CC1|nr:hypothetical protein [Paenibacillus sp. 19GGS1-52]ULO09674.1 hypothetical protein H1230_13390 [Paenibacillus sp. 19GGS1-52]